MIKLKELRENLYLKNRFHKSANYADINAN